jgi:hypothetical protein
MSSRLMLRKMPGIKYKNKALQMFTQNVMGCAERTLANPGEVTRNRRISFAQKNKRVELR